MPTPRPAVLMSACALALCTAGAAAQQGAAKVPIYSCVDSTGKRLTSDRPIAECNSREQHELNADGSVRRVVPPPMTADEMAEAEAREHDAALERAARADAIRRDRNLLVRFPNEAAHRKAREAALDDLRKSMKLYQQRLALLTSERKPLLDEAEFYVGRQMPAKLKAQLDANDAATTAQRALLQSQVDETVRINALYDAELERLRHLWSGTPAGSLGALPVAAASAPRPK